MKTKQLTQAETAEICGSLALLIHGGLGLADSVWLLQQEAKGTPKEILSGLGEYLDQGSAVSYAMEETGGFPAYVVAMTRIGEETGRLEETLSALGEYYTENDRTVRQLKNALVYPCTILLLMIVVISVLLMKVLPVFDAVYASLGSRLTGISAGLLHLGQALEQFMPVLLAALALSVVLTAAFCLFPAVRKWGIGVWQNRFGDRGICRKFNNARFARGLSMGISSGLPLTEAAHLSEVLLREIPGAAKRAAGCREALEHDVPLAEALQAGDLLPAWASRMVSAGVRGGNSDRVMEEVARRLMEEARTSLEETAAKAEPAMVLACSVLVGMILLSTMLPLMNIMASIG